MVKVDSRRGVWSSGPSLTWRLPLSRLEECRLDVGGEGSISRFQRAEVAVNEYPKRTRTVIVGAGFAGFHAGRTLSRMTKGTMEIVQVNPTDYFLYLPLLPEVTGGVLEPRRVAVPLAAACPGVQFLLGTVVEVEVADRRVAFVDPDGGRKALDYDHLVLAVGSVDKLLPIPGIAEYAYGFRSIAEALYLRDHMLKQIELAQTADADERNERCTFVVVGAGYTGTEVASQGQLATLTAARRCPGGLGQPVRWLLVERAPRILPQLDARLAVAATRILTERGVEIRTSTTVEEASARGVRLSDGEFVPTRSLVWCVGVRPDPLVESLGLPTTSGRLVVDEFLSVPGHPEIHACGDAAAVHDSTRPGELTPMTAQHAERQGRCVAHNIAAAYGYGRSRAYRHHDLGFAVDLAGARAVASPVGYPISGVPAKVLTRALHLLDIPDNRARIASDWLIGALSPRQVVQLGLVEGSAVRLAARVERPAVPAPRHQDRRSEVAREDN
ncbi:NADH dehydrogenase [Actinopolymorpha rutila]|uniref:NADH dehydrogenase n=1 Tax=Actinopolymorpha rutila TaxID=446787 RepID=A0A852ZGX4_9ACTN|nr:NAD(P)/FAD-dependent oxidoreductase [Actinopolymorpha rutila]NYH90912.1 NADH dehydrogenase [Actinopolymorpha rutila]